MKNVYLWLFMMISLGVGVGFIIIPSESEVALMYYKDGSYQKALKKYFDLLSEGNDSQNIIIPLSRIYVIQGEPEKALILLEDFAKNNPKDVGVYRELGEVYKSVQRPVEYLENLEKICRLDPNKKSIEELAKLLYEKGTDRKWARFLKLIVKSEAYEAAPEQYRNLLRYYVYQKKKADVEWLIPQMMTRQDVIDKEFFLDMIKMLLYLDLDNVAEKVSVWFLKDRPNEAPIRFEVANVLIEESKEKLLSSIEKKLGPIDVSKLEREQQVDYYLREGEDKQAYSLIYKSFTERNGDLQDSMLNELVRLGLKFADIKSLRAILDKIDPQVLMDENLIQIAERSIVTKRPELAEHVAEKLGAKFMKYNPVIAVFYESVNRGEDLESAVVKAMEHKLTLDQKINLMRIAVRNNQLTNAYTLLQESGFRKVLSYLDPVEVADIILYSGKAVKYIDVLKADTNKEKITEKGRILLFFLASGSGRDELMREMFENENIMTKSVLLEAFDLSENYMKYSLALELAEKLNVISKIDDSKLVLTEAYLLNKLYTDAVKISEGLLKYRKGKEFFLQGLAGLALERGPDKIVGYRTKGDSVAGELLADSSPSAKEQSSVALYFFSTGKFDKAVDLFMSLADSENYDSENVEYLSDIAMKVRFPRAIDWFYKRAGNAKDPVSKRRWLNYLNEMGEYEKVLELIGDDGVDKFPAVYLYALRESGRRTIFLIAVKKIISGDTSRLSIWQRVKLVTALYDEGELKDAYRIYSSIPAQDAESALTAMEIADLYVANNEYETAIRIYSGSNAVESKKSLIYLMLMGAKGELEYVRKYLENRRGVEMESIVDLFSISEKYGHSKLCLEVAQYLYDNEQSDKHKIYLVKALLLNKKFEDVFTMLDVPYSPFEEEAYISAFEGLARVKGTLAVESYKENFIKLIDVLLKRPSTSAEQKRTIGYICADVGIADRAEKIFRSLARYEKFASEDVQELLYLWGEFPNKESIQWCRTRAIKAFDVEKRSWLDYLNRIGDNRFVIDHCESFDHVPMSIIDQYLYALLLSKQFAKFADKSSELSDENIEKLTMDQKVQLTVLFKDSKNDGRAATVFKMLSEDAIFNLEPYDVAELFVLTEQIDFGFKLIESRIAEKSIEDPGFLNYMYLSSACGKIENIEAGLYKIRDKLHLSEMYHLAYRFDHSEIAVLLARELVQLEPSSEHRLMLADALIKEAKFNDAIAVLGNLVDNDLQGSMTFLSALEGMIEKGNKKEVMNHLDKLNRVAERVLSLPGLMTDRKRDIGYLFSETEQIEKAKKIFYELGENSPPTSPDIAQLIYLMGLKSTKEDVCWLEKRARNSSGYDQVIWCKFLNQTGNPDVVINIIEEGIMQ